MAWLAEQSDIISLVYLLFEWMPAQFRDLCTGAVVIILSVACFRVGLALKDAIFRWA